MKNSVRIDKDPSGMSNAGQERLDRIVVQGGYTAIGRVAHHLGDIFLAERLVDFREGWEVLWAARDAVSPIKGFNLTSTQEARIKKATETAKDYLKIFDKVGRSVH